MQLDITALQHAISTAQPCGADLAFSQAFHEIKVAKTQDDILLDQGDWIAEPKQADWAFVALKSCELLHQQSKDIRLLTWLCEAWSHLYGFIGMATAIELSQCLLQQYWNEIHPIIEDDDLDQRLGLLQGLINQIPNLIKQIPLSQQQPSYNLLDYENILYQQNNRLKYNDEAGTSLPQLEMEQLSQYISATPETEQRQNLNGFKQIREQWQQLKHVLNQHMALDAPRFAQVDAQLDSIHNNLQKIFKTDTDVFVSAPPHPEHDATVIVPPLPNFQYITQPLTFQPKSQQHEQNRQQALQVLQEISIYFEKNEPHSPVSYMLRRTIQWSQLPLHDWLTQVIKNENPLASIHELLGVRNNNNESKHE